MKIARKPLTLQKMKNKKTDNDQFSVQKCDRFRIS